MLRTYVIIVILAAFGVWMAGPLPQPSPQSRRGTLVVSSAATPPLAPAPAARQSFDAADQSIELTRDPNGYFYADVQINGATVHMVVDTGATGIALSRADAQAAGILTPMVMNDVIGEGADGEIKGEHVMLDSVALGGRTIENMPAIVFSSGSQSLLGQTFLSQFASVKIEGDKMVLR